MTDTTVIDRVLRSPRLPSLPAIALRVIDLAHQERVELTEIARTISFDPALTSKILSTVNSAFYGQARQISTISHAMVVLGLNSVKTLALGFSLVPLLKDAGGDGFDHMTFWKHSIYSAVSARSLAQQIGLAQKEEMFLAGLLQDLGMLAMSQTLGEEYRSLLQKTATNHAGLVAIERERLGTDHAQIGAALATHWKLPSILVEPIRFHHDPEQADATLALHARCVNLGGIAANVFASTQPAAALEEFYVLAGLWFNLSRPVSETLMTEIHVSSQEVSQLLDVSTENKSDAENILSRANEALMEINLQQQRQTAGLEEENQQLAEQAATDGLTGLANRRSFDVYITKQFAAMAAAMRPLSLLFLDIDHFKKVNDAHGHPSGDEVLASVAATLRRTLVAPSLAARFGGEEFVVALPGMDAAGAFKQAELIRRAIKESRPVLDTGRRLEVTVSIGVATATKRGNLTVDSLILAADRGVYEAKAAGRDCVRIHEPAGNPVNAVYDAGL